MNMVWCTRMGMFCSLFAGHHVVGDDDQSTVWVSWYCPSALIPCHQPCKWLVTSLYSMYCPAVWALDVVFAFHHHLHTPRVELVSAGVHILQSSVLIFSTVDVYLSIVRSEISSAVIFESSSPTPLIYSDWLRQGWKTERICPLKIWQQLSGYRSLLELLDLWCRIMK